MYTIFLYKEWQTTRERKIRTKKKLNEKQFSIHKQSNSRLTEKQAKINFILLKKQLKIVLTWSSLNTQSNWTESINIQDGSIFKVDWLHASSVAVLAQSVTGVGRSNIAHRIASSELFGKWYQSFSVQLLTLFIFKSSCWTSQILGKAFCVYVWGKFGCKYCIVCGSKV